MRASNFELHCVGNNEQQLDNAIAVAVGEYLVDAWSVNFGWFCLYWSEADDIVSFPFSKDLNSVRNLVKGWLAISVDLSPQNTSVGGSEIADGWELIAGWSALSKESKQLPEAKYEILRIRPHWAEYHQ